MRDASEVIAEMRSLADAEGSHAVTKAQVRLWADRLEAASTPPGDAQRLQNGGRFPAAALQSTPQPVAAEVGGRPSPRALHEAFYERTFLALTPREFDVMAKIEDRAHAIDRGNSHAG